MGSCFLQGMPNHREMLPTPRNFLYTTFLDRVVDEFVVMYQLSLVFSEDVTFKKADAEL